MAIDEYMFDETALRIAYKEDGNRWRKKKQDTK